MKVNVFRWKAVNTNVWKCRWVDIFAKLGKIYHIWNKYMCSICMLAWRSCQIFAISIQHGYSLRREAAEKSTSFPRERNLGTRLQRNPLWWRHVRTWHVICTGRNFQIFPAKTSFLFTFSRFKPYLSPEVQDYSLGSIYKARKILEGKTEVAASRI